MNRSRFGIALALAIVVSGATPGAARAGLLDNPVQWVWENTQKPLLDKIKESIMAPIEAAKNALASIIEGAKKLLENLFLENVILPGLRWAIERVLPGGAEGLKKIQNAIARYIGKIDSMVERAESMADAALAIVERSPTRLRSAQEKFEGVLEKLKSLNLQKLVEIVIGIWSEKLSAFVKSKAIELLDKAWQLIEKPINMGKQAAIAAVGSIPFCGGVLSGVVNVIVTIGLKFLRNAIFEFVGNKAAELATTGLQKVGELVAKGAAAADKFLEPLYSAMRPMLEKAMEFVKPLFAAYQKFKGTFTSIARVLNVPAKPRSPKVIVADLAKSTKAIAKDVVSQAKAAVQQAAKQIVASAKGQVEDKLLSGLMELIKQPIQGAHKVVSQAIESLMTRMAHFASEKILYPALADAGQRLLSQNGARIADDVVQSLAGATGDVMDVDGAVLLAMRGIISKNASELTRAEAELQRRHDALQKNDAEISAAVLTRLKGRLVAAARSQATRALPDALRMLDGELGKVRDQARDVLARGPLPMLAGLADWGIQKELRHLARKLFDHLEGPAIDELQNLVEMAARPAKGASGIPARLQPLAAAIKSFVGVVQKRLEGGRQAFAGLLAKVRAAKGRIAAAGRAGAGGR